MRIFELINIFYLLEDYYRIDKCRRCECFQAALWKLRGLVESMKDAENSERLLISIDRLLSASNIHSCMGCEECKPADLILAMEDRHLWSKGC
ncbi:MAG: hypothetical protein QW561_04705, partial [Candidatus Aenigmatarchaeota archaeon]